jgi:asparagine synthase (glutamine-hydrolysing)
MAASLEARSPLLDYKLSEFMASLSDRCRLSGLALKSLARDAYRDVLPVEVLQGPKRGFEVPLRRWLSNDFDEMLKDLLGSPTARVREYVCGRFVDEMVRFEGMQDRNTPYILYALLILELWLRAHT